MDASSMGPLDGIQLIGQFVSQDLVAVILECLGLGIYTLLVVCALVIIARASKDITAKKWALLAACLVMYANAAAHLGLTLSTLFEDNRRSQAIQQMLYDCLSSIQAGSHNTCPSMVVPNSYLYSAATAAAAQTALAVLLSLNMVLVDAIVLWRAWVLWPRSRTVKGISCVLMLGTTAMLLWSSTLDAGLVDFPAAFAVFVSWLTNIWSTALIVMRAWQHRVEIGAALHRGARTRAQTALLLFIESGILYTLFWAPLATYAFLSILQDFDGAFYDTPLDMLDRFMQAMATLQSSALIDVVGMYPTAVVLLVEASHQHAQRTLQLGDVPSLVPWSEPVVRSRNSGH